MTQEVTKFSTGAVRSADRAGVRYDLITPIGMRRLAETCHEGAAKYGPYNYERGMPIHDILNHGIAHLYAYLSGDRSEDHLAHAAWNCFAAMHSEELWPHLNEGTLRGPGCTPPEVKNAGHIEPTVLRPAVCAEAQEPGGCRSSGNTGKDNQDSAGAGTENGTGYGDTRVPALCCSVNV